MPITTSDAQEPSLEPPKPRLLAPQPGRLEGEDHGLPDALHLAGGAVWPGAVSRVGGGQVLFVFLFSFFFRRARRVWAAQGVAGFVAGPKKQTEGDARKAVSSCMAQKPEKEKRKTTREGVDETRKHTVSIRLLLLVETY